MSRGEIKSVMQIPAKIYQTILFYSRLHRSKHRHETNEIEMIIRGCQQTSDDERPLHIVQEPCIHFLECASER